MPSIHDGVSRLAEKLAPAKALLGKITLVCGIAMVLLGFPAQIYSNWKLQVCGIDPVLIVVALTLYVVRIPYQIAARAWYLLPSDVLGMLLGLVLLWQFIVY